MNKDINPFRNHFMITEDDTNPEKTIYETCSGKELLFRLKLILDSGYELAALVVDETVILDTNKQGQNPKDLEEILHAAIPEKAPKAAQGPNPEYRFYLRNKEDHSKYSTATFQSTGLRYKIERFETEHIIKGKRVQ